MSRNLVVVLTLLLACITPLPARVEHRDLKSGKKQIHSLALMPIYVDLSKVSMKGAEPMHEEARETELPLTLEIAAVLRDLGYQLDVDSLSKENLARDTDQRYAVDDLQKKFDAELGLMRRKPKGVRKGRFTLGDEVAKLPLTDKVDTLLFVRASAQVMTENRKAFGAAVRSMGNDTTVMDFGLVDTKTGDVIYFAKSKVVANIMLDSEEISEGITKAFADLPRAGASLPPAPQNAPPANVPESAATESGRLPGPANASSPVAIAPDSGQQPGRLRLSHGVMKDMLIKRVAPEYPGIASMNQIQGDVVMEVVIDKNGQVGQVKFLSGPVQLAPAATSAVKQWRYRPFTVNGQGYEVETQITLTFQLGR
jgi:TonB family protein